MEETEGTEGTEGTDSHGETEKNGEEPLYDSCGMATSKLDVLQGTLDLMVLQTLDAMGPLHGYGIARRIEQVSDDALQLNQGTIYASLLRLQQRRWISSSWGTSDNNRKAKFYAITKAGRKQLAAEADHWNRVAGVIGRLLRLSER
jgi:PadR family transcriptional regulator